MPEIPEELEQMVRAIFDKILEESQGSSLEPGSPPLDQLGLVSVADFYSGVVEFILLLNAELEFRDNSINTTEAYKILSIMIDHATEYGWITGDDWATISDIFLDRADIFIGDDAAVNLKPAGDDPVDWTNYLNLIMRYWDPPKGLIRDQPSADDLPLHTKIARIRSVINFLKDHRVVEREWPWVGKILHDLNVVYKIHKPNVTNTSGSGGYSAPWG